MQGREASLERLGLTDAEDVTDEARSHTFCTPELPPLSPLIGASNRIDALDSSAGVSFEDSLVHQLFEAQAARIPDARAVIFKDRTLTYSELNRRANQLARCLNSKGLGPEKLAAICMERGLDLVVAVLGVLKAGGAYLPLDPAYPDARITSILEDAAPHLVLTQRRLCGRMPRGAGELIDLDGEIEPGSDGNIEASALGLCPGSLAYVTYTSGSTGTPKGVMVEHRHVTNLWCGLDQIYRRTASCGRVALNASIAFDASVQQLVRLLSGATLFPVPEACRRDTEMMLQFLMDEQIEAIDCTPSHLKSWIKAGLLRMNKAPRLVLVGGEPIEADLWRTLSQTAHIDFWNVYGPTECTVDATVALVNGDGGTPHIGVPMWKRKIYILDQSGKPVSEGVAGEIHIGGEGVARGYLNRPDLTDERFVTDPFDSGDGARIYSTGDLARWRPDGAIEYLGRNDDQVKIRGHRVEPQEVNAQLLAHEYVSESVVIARADVRGEQRLVAYVVLADGLDRKARSHASCVLRAHLKEMLPDYMIPEAVTVLARLPVSPSGKLDRGGLPAPEAAPAARPYEAALGELEERLAAIWREILQTERVGRHDNFIELGGHSLLASQIMARIRSSFSIELPMSALFEFPTISRLSARVSEIRQSSLTQDLANARGPMKELLAEVAVIPDSEVQEWLRDLSMDGAM